MTEKPTDNNYLSKAARTLYVIGAVFASTLMVLLFALAFWEIGKAVAVFVHLVEGPEPRAAAGISGNHGCAERYRVSFLGTDELLGLSKPGQLCSKRLAGSMLTVRRKR